MRSAKEEREQKLERHRTIDSRDGRERERERERERKRERKGRCTHTHARALINGRATNINTKKKKNLLHSRAPYFIQDFWYSFTTTNSSFLSALSSFLFFSRFVLDAGHERSLSSRGAAPFRATTTAAAVA